ncbi:MAG: hypothetical protein ACLTZY_10975, partial [Alistipes indistinctus]
MTPARLDDGGSGRWSVSDGMRLDGAVDTTWALPASLSPSGTPQNVNLKFRSSPSDSIYVYTSGYANFAGDRVPTAPVSLTGIPMQGKSWRADRLSGQIKGFAGCGTVRSLHGAVVVVASCWSVVPVRVREDRSSIPIRLPAEEGNRARERPLYRCVATKTAYYTGYPTPVTKDWEVQGVVTANDRYGSFPRCAGRAVTAPAVAEIKVSGDRTSLLVAPDRPKRCVRCRCQGLVLGGCGGWVSHGDRLSANPVYQNGFVPQDEIPVRLRKREGIEAMRADTR